MSTHNNLSSKKTFSRVAVSLLLLAITLLMPTFASASPTGIDGCFFRDLNGTGIQGDAVNTSTNDETAFVAGPITLDLVSGGSIVATVTADPVTGCFDFPGIAAGAYDLQVSYPPEYYGSPVNTDNVFTPGPPPTTAGDPFTSSYSFTYNTGDDLTISGAVSGFPELRLGYFITPTGDPMIETGTGPFDTEGTCPTLTPGDDCGTYDNVVRTNDATTIGYTVTVDNVPDGSTNPLNDVVLEQTITPNPGAVVEVPSLHPSCLTTGVNPVSSIAVDPTTGVITVTCNLGPKDNGTSIIPTYIRTDGESQNGSSFTFESRVYSGTDRAQVDENSMLEGEEIFVSGAPKFDITKGNDASNPFNRVVYFQTTERLNPNTGVVEYGANYSWDITVLYDGDAKGQTALVDPITFSDQITSDFAGWDLVSCHNQPYPSGTNLPIDAAGPQDWGTRGTWNCVEDYANNQIDITVTNVDTDGSPIPTEGLNGNSLAAGPYVAFSGRVVIWYPLSEFYQRIDPDWEYGDDPIEGDYPLVNEITNFDPIDATGQSNYGDGQEPTDNNDRQVNVSIKERGGFSKHLGSYEWADGRIPDGVPVGTASSYPCGSAAAGALMSGQTQACSQGDAPVQPGEKAHFWYWMRNDGTTPWPAESAELCDAFDNSTMSLTTWTGGEPVYIRSVLPANAFIVEYATAGFNDDVTANDWSNQVAAVQTCSAPNNDWSSDPLSFDSDPTTSLEKIGMIRVRVDPTVVSEIKPSQYFQVSFPVEIRDTYNGGPRDGQTIDVGTILANNANRKYGSVPYSTTHMDAETYENSGWGDRLFLNRHQVRITKTASIDSSSPTDDDLVNVQGSDFVVWWLQPAVTAVTSGAPATGVTITDTLPAGVSFNLSCQSQQTYPDANVALSSVTANADGTTTVVFDLGTRATNEPIGPIPLCTKIDNFLDPGTDLINNVEISSDTDVSPASAREDERTVTVVASGELQLFKEVDAPLELQLDTQEYTIGWRNLSTDFDFSPPDVIDVFGYNGDSVNPLNQRTEFDSNYSGDYFLTNWMSQPTTLLVGGSTTPTNGTWYYSADDPNTIPYDADAAANDLSTGSVTWCTQAEMLGAAAPCNFVLDDVTAVRFIQTDVLLSESSVVATFEMQAGTVANPNEPADRYVNRFAARTDSVDDLVRSNEVLVQVLALNVGDLVFLDTNVDGKFTAGVDQPISGTTVELWQDAGGGVMTFVAATTTDGNGRYIFEELLEGRYEVRIPDSELNGGTLDTWTQTVLPTSADDDENEDRDQQAYDSTNGYTTSGIVTLDADTTVDPPLGLEPTGENIFFLGSPTTFDELSNLTVDLGFRGDPAIDIIKEVCDSSLGDCDLISDPLDPNDGWVETVTTPFTNDVTWRISVINTGFEMLTNVVVDDDIEDTCDRDAAAIGNINVGDHVSWICSTSTAVTGLTNTADVTGEGIGSGVEVEATNDANSVTPTSDPGLTITKYVNGDDAQATPGVVLEAGDPIIFTYSVTTNGGNMPLSDVIVTDDNGTPADMTDDFAPSYLSGDSDNDSRLDPGETWLYEATGFTAEEDQYGNVATVTGQPVVLVLERLTASDPAHYYGVTSGINVVKYVNGDDANTAPGPSIEAGEEALFTYELTNTGNWEITVLDLVDDAGTPGDASDDWSAAYVSGDSDDDGLLDPDETWLYTYETEATADRYANTAVATGEDIFDNPLEDDDVANYFGSDPAIAIDKVTNGSDDVLLADGSDIVWTYTVTNEGNVALSDVGVVDDVEGAASYISGDLNDDGLLDVDETWIFEIEGTATAGTYSNTGTATGTAPDTVDGDGTIVEGEEVEAEDPSNYYGSDPAIDLVKTTNGTDNASETGPHIAAGNPVTWTYTVTNPGNVALSDVGVVDDVEGAASYISGDLNDDGLLDVDETWIFEIEGTASAGQYANNAVASGTPPPTVNPDATVTTYDPLEAEDPDFYFGSTPAIDIVKTTNGSDDEVGPGQFIVAGSAITWTYTVTNEGNVALADVAVTDDNGTADDSSDDLTALYLEGDVDDDGLLDTDETWIFEATGTATAGDYHNIAEVRGTAPIETTPAGEDAPPVIVTADDDGFYYGAGPAISIIKAVNGDDANEAPGLYVSEGEAVSWTYVVTNIGDSVLHDVAVSDDQGVSVSCPATELAVGAEMTCEGEASQAVNGAYVNIGSVTAVPVQPDGEGGFTPVINPETGEPVDRVTDEDPAHYFGSYPSMSLEKSICTQEASQCDSSDDNHWAESTDITEGDDVAFRIVVTNTGNVELTDVALSDVSTPACAGMRPVLGVGEIWVVQCVAENVTEGFTNVATVEASTPIEVLTTGVTDNDPSSTDSQDSASVVITNDSELAIAFTGSSLWLALLAALVFMLGGCAALRFGRQNAR